jgi:4-amino-4-deoxy-L-arabinose transferase-like glycosyltransferase
LAIRHHSLLLIFFLALVPRLMFVATRSNDLVWPDSEDYHAISQSLLNDGTFVEPDGRRACRAPGYPFFLAGLDSMGINTPRKVFVVHAILGALTCVLLTLLARRFFGSRVGRLAGYGAALYPFFIYFTGLLLTETLFTFGLVALFLLMEISRDSAIRRGRRITALIAAGLVLGLLVHLRSSFLLFPLFALPLMLLRDRLRRPVLVRWGVMMALMAVVLTPWVVRNYRVFGRFIPTTLQVGESLYEANSPYADGGPAMDRIPWDTISDGPLGEAERNDFFKARAVEYIKTYPWRFVWQGLHKFCRFWNVVPNHGPYRSAFYAIISLCSYVPVMTLALLGIFVRRKAGRKILYILSPVLYYTALHMVFVGSVRYRTPVMPMVFILAAVGVGPLWGFLKSGLCRISPRWRLWALVAVPSVVLIACGLAYSHYTDSERLRLMAQQKLTEMAGGAVQIRDASFLPHKGLLLSHVLIRTRGMSEHEPAIKIATLLLRPDWGSLISGELALKAIEVEQVKINAEIDDEGRWAFLEQIRQAFATSTAPGKAPKVYVRNVNLYLSGMPTAMGRLPDLELTNIDVTLAPDPTGDQLNIRVTSEERRLGRPRVELTVSPKTQAIEGTVALDGLVVNGEFRRYLPPRLGDMWDAHAPIRARIDLDFEVAWKPDARNPLVLNGTLKIHGGRFGPDKAAWTVRNMSAVLDVDHEQFKLEEMRGVIGGALVRGRAEGRLDQGMTPVGSAAFSAEGVALNKGIRALLPEAHRKLWDMVAPGGKVDLIADVSRSDADAAPQFSARAKFLGCTARVPYVNLPVADVKGELVYRGGRLLMRGVGGRVAKGAFAFDDGAIAFANGAPFRVRAACKGVNLDHTLGEAMPPELASRLQAKAREFIKDLRVQGLLAASVTVQRGKDQPIRFGGEVALSKGAIAQPTVLLPFTDAELSVAFDARKATLKKLEGRWGEAKIVVQPMVFAYDAKILKRFKARVTNLEMTKAFWKLVGKNTERQIKPYNPKGFLDIDVDAVTPSRHGRPFDLKLHIKARDGSGKYDLFPYPVYKATGELYLDGPFLTHAIFKGKNGDADVTVEIGTETIKEQLYRTVIVRAQNGRLDKQLYNAIPPSFKKTWDILKPKGKMDVVFKKSMPLNPFRPKQYHVSVKLNLPEVEVDLGKPVKFENAYVDIIDLVPHKTMGNSYYGTARMDTTKVLGLELTKGAALFNNIADGLRISGIDAGFYGGRFKGNATILKSGVSGGFTITDANMKKVAGAYKLEDVTGRFDMAGTLTAHMGKDADMRVQGAATIRDGHIGRLPGLLNALRLLHIGSTTTLDFHEFRLAYDYDKGNLKANRIELLGDLLTLYGLGTIYRSGRIAMRFQPEVIDENSYMGIGPLVEIIKNSLVPITLEGTMEKPVWRVDSILTPSGIYSRIFGRKSPAEPEDGKKKRPTTTVPGKGIKLPNKE